LIKEKDLTLYLKQLQSLGIDPNFWCSEEYFQKAGLKEHRVRDGGTVYMSDPATDWCVLPPINPHSGYLHWWRGPERIWSDLPGFEPEGYDKTFLDYEYIYDPRAFIDMSGGKWMTFRKNSRKWARRDGHAGSYTTALLAPPSQEEIEELLVSWLGTLGEQEVHDDEVLLKYAFEGQNRICLWDQENNLAGMNIYDRNWKYINFRYSICRPEPFLAEYMRLLFYNSHVALGAAQNGVMVNDGGVLDRPSLKRFKDKMNPLKVREVHSWEMKKQGGE
jgi:hypothetical protein